MGNVNALTTQARQQTVLEAGGKEVAALMKDELPQVGRHLFSDQFEVNEARAICYLGKKTDPIRDFFSKTTKLYDPRKPSRRQAKDKLA